MNIIFILYRTIESASGNDVLCHLFRNFFEEFSLFFVFPVHLFPGSVDITVDSFDPSCHVVLNIEITLVGSRLPCGHTDRFRREKILLMGARAGRAGAGPCGRAGAREEGRCRCGLKGR